MRSFIYLKNVTHENSNELINLPLWVFLSWIGLDLKRIYIKWIIDKSRTDFLYVNLSTLVYLDLNKLQLSQIHQRTGVVSSSKCIIQQ